jgi:small subunit ribosomal protein S17
MTDKEKNTETPAAPETEADAVVETTEPVAEAAPPTETVAVESEAAAPAEPEAPAEPAAEAAPATPAEPEAPAVPQAQSQPKKKSKRLPRALRPQKTRPKRAPATGARKPISRESKPEHDRGRRQERRGVVVSDAMDKTIVVKVDTIRSHPRYKKVIRRSTKFHAHDEANTAKVGDLVRIVETRPLSKTKNWRLAEIVEAAK